MSVHAVRSVSASSLLKGSRLFPWLQRRPSALRVHEEGLKVRVELRLQRVHKLLHGGLSLQHPC